MQKANDETIEKALLTLQGKGRAMGREQQKYLLERLNKAHGGYSTVKESAIKEPAEVTRARKVISSWERSSQALKQTYRHARDKAREAVRELIYGEQYVEALKSLKRFESESF